MKWETGFVLVLIILATLSGVESVSGMASDWEYEVWSGVDELSVSDDGHVAALVSAPEVSDVYLLDKEGNLLWDREFEWELDTAAISQDGSRVIALGKNPYINCYFLDKTGKIVGHYNWDSIFWFLGSAFSPNCKYIAIAGYRSSVEKDITLINDRGELHWTCRVNIEPPSPIMSVSSNGDMVVGSSIDGVHFLKGGRETWKYEIKGYEDFVDVAMSPNGDYIVLSVSGVKGDSIHTLDKSGNLINKKSVESAPDISSVSSEGTYKVIPEDKIEIYDINNTLIEEQRIEIYDINNMLIEEQRFVKPLGAVLSHNAKYAASAAGDMIYFYDLSKATTALEENVTDLSEVSDVSEQDITVDELWNNTQVAIRNVTTVKYDQDTILTVQGESVEDYSHSKVDYEAERSYTSSSALHSAAYIDGKNEYVRFTGGDWEKQDHTYQWSMENKVEEFLGCKLPAYMNILRSEVVDGEECWVVKCWPMNPQTGIEVTATDWIAKEDYLPKKSQVRTRSTTNDIDMSTTRTIYFYDYNEPLDLPEPPTTPGFEVIFAIAGLLTVAYLIRRRSKK